MCRSICSSHGSVCADLDLPVGSVALSPFVGVQSGSPGRSTVSQLRRHPMTRSVKSLWCARQSGSSHQTLQTWSTEQLQLSSLCLFSSSSCLHSWIQMSRSNQFQLLTKVTQAVSPISRPEQQSSSYCCLFHLQLSSCQSTSSCFLSFDQPVTAAVSSPAASGQSTSSCSVSPSAAPVVSSVSQPVLSAI